MGVSAVRRSHIDVNTHSNILTSYGCQPQAVNRLLLRCLIPSFAFRVYDIAVCVLEEGISGNCASRPIEGGRRKVG